MTKREEFVFKINAFTPETIPMARLAEYMADLARLLSETTSVHFVRLDGGSTALVHAVDYEAVPKVEARISAAKSADAPAELLKINEDINRKLREDNADGEIYRTGGGQIIQFPGINTPKQITFGPVTQFGSIDGVVRRIGGKGNQIPVMLETHDGFETHCSTTRDMGKALAHLFDGPIIRCSGRGTWKRDQFGRWVLDRFVITNFSELDQRSLPEIATALQSTPDAAWRRSDNVWNELDIVRGKDEHEQ